MNESELATLLDAHDALIKACVGSGLEFSDFLAAYDGFPHNYGLEKQAATPEERALRRLFRKRIAFHLRVSGVLSGLRSVNSVDIGDAGRFLPVVGLMRLRELAARYPDFKAEATFWG